MTVATITRAADGSEIRSVSAGQYRTVAWIATAACVTGAVLFFFYREKKVLGDIERLKSEKPGTDSAE